MKVSNYKKRETDKSSWQCGSEWMNRSRDLANGGETVTIRFDTDERDASERHTKITGTQQEMSGMAERLMLLAARSFDADAYQNTAACLEAVKQVLLRAARQTPHGSTTTEEREEIIGMFYSVAHVVDDQLDMLKKRGG